MTATDELRRMLDERGVTWIEIVDPTATAWTDGTFGFIADEREDGKLELKTFVMTPEQAIAATLGDSDATATRQGAGTCRKLPQKSDRQCVVYDGGLSASFGYWTCSECGVENFEGARYCMNCGAKVVDA